MSPYLSGRLGGMQPYVPGEQPRDREYVKLNTNESPFPPLPAAVQAAEREARDLNLYSDPECLTLRKKLAALHGIDAGQVLVTNGSDEALNYVFLAYGDDERPFLFPDITYGLYPVLCRLYGIPFRQIPLREDFTVDTAACRSAHEPLILANPNAPTGIALPRAEIEQLLALDPGRMVAVDEAYVDFGGETCVPLVDRYPNLVVVQTFSKSRSLAGARLGMIFGCRERVEELNAVRCSLNPYNVNSMTLAAGAAVLDENDKYMQNCRQIAETREDTKRKLEALGFEVLPSRSNFLFACRRGLDGGRYYRMLKERGVLIRHFGQERIRNWVRISIGSPEQMRILLQKTEEILKEERI